MALFTNTDMILSEQGVEVIAACQVCCLDMHWPVTKHGELCISVHPSVRQRVVRCRPQRSLQALQCCVVSLMLRLGAIHEQLRTWQLVQYMSDGSLGEAIWISTFAMSAHVCAPITASVQTVRLGPLHLAS